MSSSDACQSAPAPRLRVGYILKRFPRLSETFILNELLALERAGVDVTVFSLKEPLDELRHDLLHSLRAQIIYPSGMVGHDRRAVGEDSWCRLMEQLSPGKGESARQSLLTKGHAIARLAEDFGLQHLHAHFASDAATVALVAAKLAGLGFSFTAHARDIYHQYVSPDVDNAARRRKLLAADFVATVSAYNRRHLLGLAGARARVVTLYNGIDLSRFTFTGQETRPARKILAVGRLVEKKGFEDLVEACRILHAKGAAYSCDIIGDGELRRDLSARIEQAGIGHGVRLLGAMSPDEVLAHMKRASVMVLPCKISESGDRDGLPTVLLEALAVGLPAVTTDVAGIPEIVVHEQTGLLAPPSRPDELARSVLRLFDDDRLRERLARAGRRRAEDLFDLTTNADRLRQLFVAAILRKTLSNGDSDANCLSFG